MTITSRLQDFSNWIYAQYCRLLLSDDQIFQPPQIPLTLQPPPPPPIDIQVPEAAAAAAQPVLLGPEAGYQNMNWPTIIVAFCLSSAIGVALSSSPAAQLHPPNSPTTTFHLFSFTISLCFASFFVRHFIHHSKSQLISRLLYGIGIFFAVTAFFIAITIHFPLYLKLITWLVYALSFLLIIVSKFVR